MASVWNFTHKSKVSIQASAEEVGRLVRFGFVGVFITFLYPLMTLGVFWLGIANATAASVIGHLICAFFSYVGHAFFSFGVTGDHRLFVKRFIVVGALSLVANIFVTWELTARFGLSSIVPVVVVTILIPGVNFLCSRFWIFEPGLKVSASVEDERGYVQ